MARLIEFFTQSGELVLDPFAGVGGTLLGAAIARGPRRAIGIELDPRWAAVYRETVEALAAERDGPGPSSSTSGPNDPGGVRGVRPVGAELRHGDARGSCRAIPDATRRLRRHRSAVQRPAADDDGRRQARRGPRQPADGLRDGRRLARDLANLPDYAAFLDAMAGRPRRAAPGPAARPLCALIVRDAYQDGRYLFTAADLAARADAVGLVPKGDIAWYQAGTRLRPYGYPRVFVPNIAHQHIVVLRKAPAARRG